MARSLSVSAPTVLLARMGVIADQAVQRPGIKLEGREAAQALHI